MEGVERYEEGLDTFKSVSFFNIWLRAPSSCQLGPILVSKFPYKFLTV